MAGSDALKAWKKSRFSKSRRAGFTQGFDDLYLKLAKLGEISNTKDARNVMLKSARKIERDAKQRLESQVIRRTGIRLNPQKAIVTKLFSKQKPRNPMAFVAWDYKVSRLGHLFEYGTKNMSARPFFRKAIDGSHSIVTASISAGFKKLIERTATKK